MDLEALVGKSFEIMETGTRSDGAKKFESQNSNMKLFQVVNDNSTLSVEIDHDGDGKSDQFLLIDEKTNQLMSNYFVSVDEQGNTWKQYDNNNDGVLEQATIYDKNGNMKLNYFVSTDANGMETYRYDNDNDGVIDSATYAKVNQDGSKNLALDYNYEYGNENINSKAIQTVDANGNKVIQYYWNDEDNIPDQTVTYKTDENGREVKITTDKDGNKAIAIDLNGDGKYDQFQDVDANNNLKDNIFVRYEDGNKIVEHDYNNDGHIDHVEIFNQSNERIQNYYLDFEKDANGNEILKYDNDGDGKY